MRYGVALGLFLSWLPNTVWAVDSYRYMHVTIETPWMIFLFLLPAVLMPFILMAILYWRQASRKVQEADQEEIKEQE